MRRAGLPRVKMRAMTIARLDLRLHGFVTPPGLRLERLTIGGEELVPSSKGLDSPHPLPFAATLVQEDLQAFLARKNPTGLENATLEMTEDGITVTGQRRVVLVVPVRARVTLAIEDGRRLVLRLHEASAFGASVTNLAEGLVEKANPVLDVDDLPVPCTLERVEHREGELVVHGAAHPPFAFGSERPSEPDALAVAL